MESDTIIESPAKNRFSMYDFSTRPEHNLKNRHSFNVSELPHRSRSVMNLSTPPAPHFKKRSWVLPESPTVSETQSHLTKRRSLSGALSPQAPKVPNVERYLEVFSKLKSSYSGFVKALEELDRAELSAKENLLFDKCLRKLSQRLQKIHDLHELYIHQEHMKEGARNLMKTMERENSKKIKNRIEDVKDNYKKNILRLCAVEDEINNLAGSIKIQIIGLIGFARLSPGDVYGVQFKHAYDKSSSKCKVVGQGQKWTNPISSFRISLLHDLHVKVQEVYKMNRNNIGVVTCPISNFISPEGQEFVLPVNSTGTLKLKLGVVWSPFSNKEETAFRGKITITEFPNARLDSLSDSSQTGSPCSTPKNGTLSSMPRLSSGNGTLSPVRISVHGDYFPTQASVIRHWKTNEDEVENEEEVEDEASNQATLIEREDSTWIASIKSSSSMPNIASLSTDTNDNIDSNHANSITGPDESVENNSQSDVKKKPKPVTLGPNFIRANENVTINSTSSCSKLDEIAKDKLCDETAKRNQAQSLGRSFKMIPSPDYSPPTSPVKTSFPNIPEIIEPECHSQRPSVNLIVVNGGDVAKSVTSSEESITLVNGNGEATTKTTTETAEGVIPVTVLDNISECSIGGDQITAEIKTLFLQLILKIAEFPEDLRSMVVKLEMIINQLANGLQEKKKNNLARSVSVENALNSIDCAFDFLADHQTLKSSPDSGAQTPVHPTNYRTVKEVLHHHLCCCQTLLEMMGVSSTPLKAKADKCIKHLQKQTAILEVLQSLLTSSEEITAVSACKKLEKNAVLRRLWKETNKENELFCTAEHMLQTLKTINLYGTFFGEEVSTTVMDQMRMTPEYPSDSDIISVFQFEDYFSRFQDGDPVLYFQDFEKELRCLKALKSRDDLVVLSTLQERKKIPLTASCLEHIALLLANKNTTIQNVTASFLTMIPNNVKVQAIDVYVEMLEAEEVFCRVGALHALSCLEAISARDQIVYLWKNDEREVRNAAFETLKVVGFPQGLTPNVTRRSNFAEVATRL